MKILDVRHTCANCRFNDGMVYTSNPVKYKCTFDNNYYEGMHSCHFELVPIVRCKDCKYSREKNSSEWYLIEDVLVCTSPELAFGCEAVFPEDYCSYGEKYD